MSWDTCKFSSLYAIPSRNGLTRPSSVRGKGYKMINMGELFSHGRIGNVPMELVELEDSKKEAYEIKEGDLIFARQSLVLEGAGKCSWVKEISEYTTFESHLIRVRLNPEVANSLFYYYYFKSPQSPIRSIVQQCAQAGIRASDLEELNVLYPPLHIQRRIADILSAYDDLIENNLRQIKLLEEAAMRLYREWFVFMRFPGHESVRIVDGVPEGWDTRLLPDCVDYMRGISYSAKDIEGTDGVYLLNLKNVKEYGGYNFSEDAVKSYSGTYKEEDVVKCGDLIMAVTDMTPECRIVGSVALVPPLDNIAVISMDLMKLIPREISTIYLYHTFRFGNISHLLSRRANGTNVLHLKTETMEDVSILLPTDDLVEQYEMLVLPMQETIELYEKQNRSLVLARDALLPRLMNGGEGLKLEGGAV